MNVFEDLIEELRDENLLEQTVIDVNGSRNPTSPGRKSRASDDQDGPATGSEEGFELSAAESDTDEESERDFFRKRAIDEISSLQMVEHIISGVEREHLKIIPASYDDLQAKKALHNFLQVQGESATSEYAQAEFKLMQETEGWSSALSERDERITVANLRRFCENSQPALSSQALIALGRFYRNAAYCELARSKFDLVMTRLFSREVDDNKRRLLFERADMIGHIKTLYANWTSIALYSTEETSTQTRAVVAGFEDRMAEAENAETFEQLIENSFFEKVHEFKEATGEMFFTPEVVAVTIDCNVRIGNKFVDLIQRERDTHPANIEAKYGYAYDQIISDAAGKTLHLVELLKGLDDRDHFEGRAAVDRNKKAPSSAPASDTESFFSFDFRGVNKWLLATTILLVIASAALYFWSDSSSPETSSAEAAKDANLDGTQLKEYVRSGRLTGETFYAITLPTWDQLSDEKKKEVLRQAVAFADQNGRKLVRLQNVRGRAVAYATETEFEILNPTP